MSFEAGRQATSWQGRNLFWIFYCSPSPSRSEDVGNIRHVNLLNISNIYWIFYCSPPLSDDAGLDGAIRHVNWEEDGDGEMKKFAAMTKTGVVFGTPNLWSIYSFHMEQCSLEIFNLFNIQFKLHTFVSLVHILYLFGRLHCVALIRAIYSHNF